MDEIFKAMHSPKGLNIRIIWIWILQMEVNGEDTLQGTALTTPPPYPSWNHMNGF